MASGKMNFEEWKKMSYSNQVNFSNLLGDRIWDEFKYPQDEKYLFQKIAIPLFGKPTKESDDFGLSKEHLELVNDIKAKCIEHSIVKKKICIAVIFVCVYINEDTHILIPLFRVRSHNSQSYSDVPNNVFIDHLGRVYKSWQQYKDDNTWNKSWLCVPASGFYCPDLKVAFLDQSSRGEVLEIVDNVSTVSNIVTGSCVAVGAIMSFFPPTAPLGVTLVTVGSIAGAPGAAYGAGRSIGGLIDRGIHEQSISLEDSEARQYWLIAISSLLSVGTLSAGKLLTRSVAKLGHIPSAGSRAVFTALNVTSVTLSGAGVLNSMYELSQKKEVTALDVFQLTTSVFFFTHSVVSFQTAGSLIKDIQRKQIGKIRSALPTEQQNVHDALLQGSREIIEPGKVREMHGNAKFIKEMSKIDNIGEFYSHFQIKRDGQLHINSELTIHPRAFLQMNEADRTTMLNLSRQLKNNEIDLKKFNQAAGSIQKEYRFKFDRHRVDAQEYLKKMYGVRDLRDIQVGSSRLGNAKPEDIDRLEQVVKNSFHNGDKELIKLANEMAKKQGASNVTEYAAVGEYAVRKVDEEVARRRAENPNPKRNGGRAADFYRSQIVNEYLQEQSRLNGLNDSFTQLRIKTDAKNVGDPRFKNSMAAANHYDKHKFFPKVNPLNNLSPETYFNIATDMAGGSPSDIKWTQDGSSLKCTFNSEKYGATAISYKNLANKTSVIATLMATNANESRLYNLNT